MTIEMLREFLGWSTLINLGLLYWWFLFFMFAHDWMYQLHSKWFNLSVERFDSIHYAGMAFFKISIFLFNLAPYLALWIAG
jgi:hypothetical protein